MLLLLLAVHPAWGQLQIAACATAPAKPQDRRSNPSTLRVASFNAEWLFDGTTSQAPWTPEQAAQHLKDVAKVTAEINADLLTVVEVQSCDMLSKLAAEMTLHGVAGYIPYLIPGKDTATGQNVGFLTRIDPFVDVYRTENRVDWPLAGNTCGYTGTGGTYGVSKHFVAKFDITGLGKLALIGLHFLAFPTTKDRCAQREAQASVIRALVEQSLTATEEVIVLGDFNDYSDAVPDVASNKPTSRVIKIIRSGLNAGTSLAEAGSLVRQSDRYTSVYDSDDKLSQIDHILVSQGVSRRITASFIYHSYTARAVSDHWPVVIDVQTSALESASKTVTPSTSHSTTVAVCVVIAILVIAVFFAWRYFRKRRLHPDARIIEDSQ